MGGGLALQLAIRHPQLLNKLILFPPPIAARVAEHAAAAQLALLPGTTQAGMLERADWLLAMVSPFLDAPRPQVERDTVGRWE